MEKEIEKLKERIYILQKPVEFEGKSYQKLDFSKIDSLTTKDFREIEKEVQASGQMLINMEYSSVGCCAILRKATDLVPSTRPPICIKKSYTVLLPAILFPLHFPIGF